MPKEYFRPLFDADTFFDVDENNIDSVFVDSLNTPHRRRLASNLRLFLAYLSSIGLNSFELWIDGSFTTVNPDPMDIDIVCFISANQLNEMTDENLEQLAYLASEEGRSYTREKWHIDYYHCPFDSIEDRNYWKNKFSSDEHGNRKGIGRIRK